MDLTAEQRLIRARVGDVDPNTGLPVRGTTDGIVAWNLPALWNYYQDRAAIAPRLQSLYVERDCIDLLLAVWQDEVDTAVGQGALSERLGQRTDHLLARRKTVLDEIVRIEARAGANRAPVVGLITKTAPVMAPVPGQWCPDPPSRDGNSPTWSGSVYWRLPFPPITARPY